MKKTHFIAAAVALLLFGFLVRVVNVTELPVYLDEAQHIPRAQNALMGQPFVGDFRKFYLYQYLKLFQPTGPEGVWISRTSVAILSTLSTASTIALGALFHDRRTGLLAGGLYTLLPFAVFHERVALADPLVAAYTNAALVLMALVALRPRWWMAIPLGGLLALAFLTKQSAVGFLVMPFLAVALLAWRKEHARRSLLISGGALLLALVWIVVVYGVIARGTGATLPETLFGSVMRSATGDASGGSLTLDFERVTRNLGLYFTILRFYAGWVVLGLLALAAVWLVIKPQQRGALLFLAAAICAVAVPTMVADGLPTVDVVPRYFAPTVGPMAALAMLSLGLLQDQIGEKPVVAWGSAVLVTLALLPGARFAFSLATDPASARLYPSQRTNWISGWGSGMGQEEIAAAIIEAHEGSPMHVLGYDKYMLWARTLVGSRLTSGDYFQGGDEQLQQVAEWLAAGETVFYLTDNGRDMAANPPHNAMLEPVGQFQTTMYGRLTLFRVVGARPPLADAVLDARAPDFDQMTPNYEALAASLAASPRPVVMFPAGQAQAFAADYELDLLPLTMPEWPISDEVVADAVERAKQRLPGATLDVVLVDQTVVDPAQTVALSVHDNFYWLNSDWYGLIQHQTVVEGPAEPDLQPVESSYEQVIRLHEGAIVDRTVSAGDVVRVALVWSSDEVVQDPYYIYAHLMDEEATLYAQNDHEAGGGLFAMQGWQPGQRVSDRFAIQLPADVPPGRYQIRIGVYHPVNGARLPVTSGDDIGPDYTVLGWVTVEE